MTTLRKIVLLGGGFSDDPDTLLDDFVLSHARAKRPKICFLPTASGDSDGYVRRFHVAFGERDDCEPAHLPLFRRTHHDLRAFLLAQDIVYVGGGNTANMLAVWREHGVDDILREAYGNGTLLCGISAGAACWFEACLTDSFGPLAPLTGGLGILPGSMCPHYDSEAERRAAYLSAVASGALPEGWALDDGAAALFADGRLADVVSRAPNSALYQVARCVEAVRSAAPDAVETRFPASLPASRRLEIERP
ncbi:peptidase E [Kitasatospora sp. NBC_00085]|uniref:Type 1 glutamine amidotransferase-like domain-containing protein n=1 Tax=unclassified Kitasatospora TaxID=2633591 RepID=UPI00325322FB